jgi:hypothetical protein
MTITFKHLQWEALLLWSRVKVRLATWDWWCCVIQCALLCFICYTYWFCVAIYFTYTAHSVCISSNSDDDICKLPSAFSLEAVRTGWRCLQKFKAPKALPAPDSSQRLTVVPAGSNVAGATCQLSERLADTVSPFIGHCHTWIAVLRSHTLHSLCGSDQRTWWLAVM